MPALRDVSGEEARRAFERDGWSIRKSSRPTKGSHQWHLKKPGNPNILTVPNHRALKYGLLKKLIRAADLSEEEFLALLRGERR